SAKATARQAAALRESRRPRPASLVSRHNENWRNSCGVLVQFGVIIPTRAILGNEHQNGAEPISSGEHLSQECCSIGLHAHRTFGGYRRHRDFGQPALACTV